LVRHHSSDGARLAALLEPVLAAPGSPRGGDAVHGDLLVTQLLLRRGRLSGVLDWDAAGRGDRCQDLALLFYNTFAHADRSGRPVPTDVPQALAGRAAALCGQERFAWLLAYEILLALAFVAERNPRHLDWRTALGLRVLEAQAGMA
jgi:aminoglycoside phosphotransferase (APT) family kinase protein